MNGMVVLKLGGTSLTEQGQVLEEVAAGARFGRQLEHAHEHGGHPLAMGHPVALDQVESVLGVEPLHHHHRPAEGLHRGHIAQGRGVIERGRREIDRLRAQPIAVSRSYSR